MKQKQPKQAKKASQTKRNHLHDMGSVKKETKQVAAIPLFPDSITGFGLLPF